MDNKIAAKYYSRNDIKQALINFSKDREIAVRFDSFFGKRPDILENNLDIEKFIKKNVTSFHCSEELWLNPLFLGNSKDKQDIEKNRIGWDLILDLDGVDFEFAKIVGKILIEFLNELGIKNISTKFSGNKGFHLGIPFQAFSSEIIGFGETRLLFPKAPQKIALYLMEELKNKISSEIIKYCGTIEQISKKYNIPLNELIIKDKKSNNLNYMKLIEIDTILITSRHLFRMPYSLHEKSGLASIPVENKRIMEFQKQEAKPENVDPKKYINFEFLKYDEKNGKDGNNLLMKAYDEISDDEMFKETIEKHKLIKKENYGTKNSQFGGTTFLTENIVILEFEITEKIELKDFPKTINYILNNKFEDGKKRALFILLTFLYGIKWEKNHIEEIIIEWNSKQEIPLKLNYLKAQLYWFSNQKNKISTPNFNSENYYKSIGIPNKVISQDLRKFKTKVKNPLHYIFLFQKTIKKSTKIKSNDKTKVSK